MCSVQRLIFLLICFSVTVAVYGRSVKSWPKIFKPQKQTTKLYMENNGGRVLILTEDKKNLKDCYLSGDQYIIQLSLQLVNQSEVKKVSKHEMHELVELCTYAKWSGTLGNGGAEVYGKMGNASAMLIYPGTKWCGAGNVSDGYDDLGPERETDMCCREHDHCPDSIEKFGSKHGLDNNGPFTKSNCECDDKFYNCLREVNAESSNRVGKIYFNYIRMECFKNTYPIIQCKKLKGTKETRLLHQHLMDIPEGWTVPMDIFRLIYRSIRPRCIEYDLDETRDPIWQWFDAKEYKSLDERTKLYGRIPDIFENFIPLDHSENKIHKGRISKNALQSRIEIGL